MMIGSYFHMNGSVQIDISNVEKTLKIVHMKKKFEIYGTFIKTDHFWVYEHLPYNKYKYYSSEEINNMSPFTLIEMDKFLNERKKNKGIVQQIYNYLYGENDYQQVSQKEDQIEIEISEDYKEFIEGIKKFKSQ